MPEAPAPSAPPDSTPHGLRLALAAVLLAATAAVLVAQAVQFDAGPSPEAWRAAAGLVRAEFAEGDAFVVVPAWESRPRTHLEELPYIPAESPTWSDLRDAHRLWMLVEDGRQDEARAMLPPPWQVVEERPGPEVAVLRAERPAADPTLWDVLGSLDTATVTREPLGRSLPCSRYTPGLWQGWSCPGGARIGESIQVVTNDKHRCVWFPALDRDGPLRMRFHDVPVGSRIVGHAGQPIDAIRADVGQPLTFELLVDGQLVHQHTYGLHEEGFLSFDVPVSTHGTAEVEFRVHSNDPAMRHLCFEARTVR